MSQYYLGPTTSYRKPARRRRSYTKKKPSKVRGSTSQKAPVIMYDVAKKYSRAYPSGRRTSSFSYAPYKRIAPHFNKEEMLYIQAVTNPFGHQDSGDYIPPVGSKVLDGSTPITSSGTLTHTFSLAVGTDELVIKIQKPKDVTKDYGIEYATAVAAAGTPTASTVVTSGQWSYYRSNIRRVRVVGMGLKVIAISAPDDTAGTLRGGITDNPLRTAAAVWEAYSASTNLMSDNLNSAADGITVRWAPTDNSDYEFVEYGVVDEYTLTDTISPCVRFTGGKANTVLQISFIIHLESVMSTSFDYNGEPSPVSSKWAIIQSICSNPKFQPMVTDGSSFKDIIKKTGYVTKEILMFLKKYGPLFGKAASVFV